MEKQFIIVGTFDNYPVSDKKIYHATSKEEHVNRNFQISDWREEVTTLRGVFSACAEKFYDSRVMLEDMPWMEFDTLAKAQEVAEHMNREEEKKFS